MSGVDNGGSAGSNAGALPAPSPELLRPHIVAGQDLIPLHRPGDRRGGRPLGKSPRDRNWPRKSYEGQDPRNWMADGHNVGVRLRPEDLVIDIDPRHFPPSDDVKSRFISDFGIDLDGLPHTATGDGGDHFWLSKPANLRIRAKLDAYPGIEFKTAGTQAVAGGSVHPKTGRFYVADDLFGELGSPPSAPAALLEVLAAHPVHQAGADPPITNDQLGNLLTYLDACAFRDHDRWLRLMMACHHGTDGAGIDEFLDWSASDPDFADRREENARRWRSLSSKRPRGVTIATLLKAVADAGHPEVVAALGRTSASADFGQLLPLAELPPLANRRDGQPAASYANCLTLIEHAPLGLAYDELARRPMLRAPDLPWSVNIGRELNDDVMRMIRFYLIFAAGLEFSKDDVSEACLTLARKSPFNPVTDYLDALTWDDTPRLDDWLIRYMGAPDSEYVRAVGRLVLIAAVRRARQPGCKFDQVAIFEGAQGTGKSSALKILGGDLHSDAELGRLDSKEAPIVLQGVWIHELGELTAMNRSEVEDLKAFVSRFQDTYRAPYERLPRTEPRRCIFIGTTNSDSYLQDLSGNRRFWPVATGQINLDALKRDRDQLWAEAAEAEAAGASIELPRHLWAAAGEEQAGRLADDPWAERVRLWVDGQFTFKAMDGSTMTVDRVDRVHSSVLLDQALEIDPARQTQHTAKRLRSIMRSIGGWTYKRSIRIDGSNAAGYLRDDTEGCDQADLSNGEAAREDELR